VCIYFFTRPETEATQELELWQCDFWFPFLTWNCCAAALTISFHRPHKVNWKPYDTRRLKKRFFLKAMFLLQNGKLYPWLPLSQNKGLITF